MPPYIKPKIPVGIVLFWPLRLPAIAVWDRSSRKVVMDWYLIPTKRLSHDQLDAFAETEVAAVFLLG
jgi:hypothetical protein